MFDEIYPLLVAFTFALSSVMIKRLQKYASPLFLNFLRTLVGGVIFPLQLLMMGNFRSLWQLSALAVWYLTLSVIFNVVVGDSLYFAAQNRIGVNIATPIVNIYPLFAIIMAVLFLGETVTWIFVGGSLIIITGIIILSISGKNDTQIATDHKLFGFTFATLSMLSYALGVVVLTVASLGLDPVVANTVRLPVGTILLGGAFLLPNTTIVPESNKQSMKSMYFLLMIVAAGVLGTYLSSLFYVISTQKLGASRSAVLTSLGPLFALPLAVVWLKEKITWQIVFGTILTLIGLWLVLS